MTKSGFLQQLFPFMLVHRKSILRWSEGQKNGANLLLTFILRLISHLSPPLTGPAMTSSDRRSVEKPLNSQLRKQLTIEQSVVFSSLENFGWSIAFIRREPFRDPTVIVSDGAQIAQLAHDGSIIDNPPIILRESRAAR